MSDALTEKKALKGFDASGNEVDLSEFEESFYKPGRCRISCRPMTNHWKE